jgi:hypothetical protein
MHSTIRPTHRVVRRGAPVLLAAGVLLLGACSSDDDGTDGTTTSAAATETVTQTVTPSATADPPTASVTPPPGETTPPTDDPGSCSGLTGKDAVMRWYGDVPLPEQGYPYAPGAATVETYDPCAALSSVILPVAHATASSPTQVMLFHHGNYIGTATSKAYGFYPDIERLADDSLQVTWHWPQDGDANADPTGRSTATFTWNDATGQVDMAGEVPPV